MNKEQEGKQYASEDVQSWVEHSDTEPMPEEEVAGYVERIEQAAEKQQSDAPTDDQGQAMVAHVQPVLPSNAVVLPLTQAEFEEGMQARLMSSARWLAEWCLYLIKKYGNRVFFRSV